MSEHRGGTTSRRRRGLRARLSDQVARVRQRALAQSRAMEARAQAESAGTRKRAVVTTVVGFLALGAMFSAVSQSVIAVNFTTGNSKFKIYSNYLDAEKAAGFLAPSNQQDDTDIGVAEIGIVSAKLAGLCAIATESFLGTSWSLKITAGQAVPDTFDKSAPPTSVDLDAETGKIKNGTHASLDKAITANNLFINSDILSGYGNRISGLNLGQAAGSITPADLTWPTGQGGTVPSGGDFGLFANQLNVGGLDAETFGLNLAGAITLPDLKITVESGSQGQSDCSSGS